MSVRSVARAIEILDVVSQQQGIGVSDIARQLDLHKSTVSRLLQTLEDLQAVERTSASSGFQVGAKIRRIANNTQHPANLINIAMPYMEELGRQIGEDVGLAIPDGDHVCYVAQVHSEQPAIHVRDWTGMRYPVHTTSSGKLMMAFWSAERLDAYLQKPLVSRSKGTLTDPDVIRAALTVIREQRFDWSFNEFAEEFSAASAPIFGTDEQIVAVLNIYAPSYRFPPDKQNHITDLFLDVSQRLTAHFGNMDVVNRKIRNTEIHGEGTEIHGEEERIL
jgi:DNA-binding IclR family transcriptional regulator